MHWDTVLARYREFIGAPCVVRGELRDAGAVNADGVVERIEAFMARHRFLRDYGPTAIAGDYHERLVAAGCKWPPKPDTPAWHWRRATLLANFDYMCRYCGRPAMPTGSRTHALRMEVEHIHPKSKASPETVDPERWENLTVACRSCNVVKGQADLNVFVTELVELAEAVARQRSQLEELAKKPSQ